ncbi:actin cortical patch protein [Diplocarpon rosae]|nr:actin cortical patch protein [Diplocarpon rosae]
MDLTPIRIPGKRKRENTKTARAARKLLNRRPGRPPKQSQHDMAHTTLEAPVPGPISHARKRSLKNLKSKRKMSLLERLPTELLERVFQFCLNLDLPKASPIIAAKLSSQTICDWTVMRVFGPSWDKDYGRDMEMGAVNEGKWGREEADHELQSRVLRCRWADLKSLVRAKDLWVQRYAKGRLSKPHYFLKSPNPPDSAANTPEVAEDVTSRSTLSQAEFLDRDFAGFLTYISAPDGPWPWTTISWTTYPSLLGVEIPQSLLLGPWSPTVRKHLFHLIKSGATLSWLTSTSGEAALEGWRSAIVAGDVAAVHLLAWSGLVDKIDVEMLCWALRNVGGEGVEGKVRMLNQLLRLGFTELGAREGARMERELLDLRDEGLLEGNEEKLALVRGVVSSQTLSGKMDIRV